MKEVSFFGSYEIHVYIYWIYVFKFYFLKLITRSWDPFLSIIIEDFYINRMNL